MIDDDEVGNRYSGRWDRAEAAVSGNTRRRGASCGRTVIGTRFFLRRTGGLGELLGVHQVGNRRYATV